MSSASKLQSEKELNFQDLDDVDKKRFRPSGDGVQTIDSANLLHPDRLDPSTVSQQLRTNPALSWTHQIRRKSEVKKEQIEEQRKQWQKQLEKTAEQDGEGNSSSSKDIQQQSQNQNQTVTSVLGFNISKTLLSGPSSKQQSKQSKQSSNNEISDELEAEEQERIRRNKEKDRQKRRQTGESYDIKLGNYKIFNRLSIGSSKEGGHRNQADQYKTDTTPIVSFQNTNDGTAAASNSQQQNLNQVANNNSLGKRMSQIISTMGSGPMSKPGRQTVLGAEARHYHDLQLGNTTSVKASEQQQGGIGGSSMNRQSFVSQLNIIRNIFNKNTSDKSGIEGSDQQGNNSNTKNQLQSMDGNNDIEVLTKNTKFVGNNFDLKGKAYDQSDPATGVLNQTMASSTKFGNSRRSLPFDAIPRDDWGRPNTLTQDQFENLKKSKKSEQTILEKQKKLNQGQWDSHFKNVISHMSKKGGNGQSGNAKIGIGKGFHIQDAMQQLEDQDNNDDEDEDDDANVAQQYGVHFGQGGKVELKKKAKGKNAVTISIEEKIAAYRELTNRQNESKQAKQFNQKYGPGGGVGRKNSKNRYGQDQSVSDLNQQYEGTQYNTWNDLLQQKEQSQSQQSRTISHGADGADGDDLLANKNVSNAWKRMYLRQEIRKFKSADPDAVIAAHKAQERIQKIVLAQRREKKKQKLIEQHIQILDNEIQKIEEQKERKKRHELRSDVRQMLRRNVVPDVMSCSLERRKEILQQQKEIRENRGSGPSGDATGSKIRSDYVNEMRQLREQEREWKQQQKKQKEEQMFKELNEQELRFAQEMDKQLDGEREKQRQRDKVQKRRSRKSGSRGPQRNTNQHQIDDNRISSSDEDDSEDDEDDDTEYRRSTQQQNTGRDSETDNQGKKMKKKGSRGRKKKDHMSLDAAYKQMDNDYDYDEEEEEEEDMDSQDQYLSTGRDSETSSNDSIERKLKERQKFELHNNKPGSDFLSGKGTGSISQSQSDEMRQKILEDLEKEEEGEVEAKKIVEDGLMQEGADYSEFMKARADVLKYLTGDFPWYRYDLRFYAWFVKAQFEQFELAKGIKNRTTIQLMVESLRFDLFWGGMIIINMFTIGAGAHYTTSEKPGSVYAGEIIFTLSFVFEFVLRTKAHGLIMIFNRYGFCDFCLVWVTGVFTLFILEPLGADVPILRGITVFRVLRLSRVCYECRFIPGFSQLWMLVQAIVSSAGLLLWLLLMGFFVLVFFGMFLQDLTGAGRLRDGKEMDENMFCSHRPAFCQTHLGSLGGTMYTLFQIGTFDGTSQVLRVFRKSPSFSNALFIYFILFSFLVFMGIVFFNIVSGVLMQNIFYSAQKDEESAKRRNQVVMEKTTNDLVTTFEEMDKDGSGELSKSEFAQLLTDARFVGKMRILDIEVAQLPDIFRICDDGDGQVSATEFCTGVIRMLKSPQALDMMAVTRMAKLTSRSTFYINNELERGILEGRLKNIHQNIIGIKSNVSRYLRSCNNLLEKIYENDVSKAIQHASGFLPIADHTAPLPYTGKYDLISGAPENQQSSKNRSGSKGSGTGGGGGNGQGGDGQEVDPETGEPIPPPTEEEIQQKKKEEAQAYMEKNRREIIAMRLGNQGKISVKERNDLILGVGHLTIDKHGNVVNSNTGENLGGSKKRAGKASKAKESSTDNKGRDFTIDSSSDDELTKQTVKTSELGPMDLQLLLRDSALEDGVAPPDPEEGLMKKSKGMKILQKIVDARRCENEQRMRKEKETLQQKIAAERELEVRKQRMEAKAKKLREREAKLKAEQEKFIEDARNEHLLRTGREMTDWEKADFEEKRKEIFKNAGVSGTGGMSQSKEEMVEESSSSKDKQTIQGRSAVINASKDIPQNLQTGPQPPTQQSTSASKDQAGPPAALARKASIKTLAEEQGFTSSELAERNRQYILEKYGALALGQSGLPGGSKHRPPCPIPLEEIIGGENPYYVPPPDPLGLNERICQAPPGVPKRVWGVLGFETGE